MHSLQPMQLMLLQVSISHNLVHAASALPLVKVCRLILMWCRQKNAGVSSANACLPTQEGQAHSHRCTCCHYSEQGPGCAYSWHPAKRRFRRQPATRDGHRQALACAADAVQFHMSEGIDSTSRAQSRWCNVRLPIRQRVHTFRHMPRCGTAARQNNSVETGYTGHTPTCTASCVIQRFSYPILHLTMHDLRHRGGSITIECERQ